VEYHWTVDVKVLVADAFQGDTSVWKAWLFPAVTELFSATSSASL